MSEEDFPAFNIFDRNAAAEFLGSPFINWLDIDDDAGEQQLAELRMFIGKFVRRYNVDLTIVPNCWEDHTVVVDELTAVWRMWSLLMDPGDSGFGPIQFWEHFELSKQRLRNLHTCNASKHVPDRIITDRI